MQDIECASTQEIAMQVFILHTSGDRIIGTVWTNDNLDKGDPSEEESWPVNYANREVMTKATGLSHVGISGIVVDVYLDGKKI
jgi:hypothetical protein